MKVYFEFEKKKIDAELDGEFAEKLKPELPFGSRAHVWGEQIYFGVPIVFDATGDLRQNWQVGDVVYWEEAGAICILAGRTPASDGANPVTTDKTMKVGRITGDVNQFKSIKHRDKIEIKLK